MNLRTTKLITAVASVALLVFALACVAQAQSGRRAPRPQEIAPVPTPTPAPEPKKHDTDVTQKINLLVLADSFSAGQSSMSDSIVQGAFMQRLHESGSLVIDTDSSRTTRGGAQKRAKEEKDRFVVWMTLRYNGGMGAEPIGIRARPENYSIEFAVYDPVTGRTRAGGTVYMRAGYGTIGGVAVGAPSCYPATYASELEFIYGAIDAANRVMKSLDLPLPPLCGR
ncbi:MAG: hypothetical protein M3268_09660 [Acidobacteriota bacterium]|nr:hypothetical protein [Acidobacteriota bacterium]